MHKGGYQHQSGRREETKSGIQPQRDSNAPVLRYAQEQHHSESLAQGELPSPQGRSTPEPAQQHPPTRVGDPSHAWHTFVFPKSTLVQLLGCSLSRFVPVPPFTLSSAHLLQLMQCHGHEQRAPSTAQLINQGKLIPRSDSSHSTSHQHWAGHTPHTGTHQSGGCLGAHSTAATTKSIFL